MKGNSNLKLIAVLDSYHLKLYEANGLKITDGPKDIKLPFTHHKESEKLRENHQKNPGLGLGFEPRTMPEEIDQNDSAKLICQYLDKLFGDNSHYRELIIIVEPRMLGFIRENLSKNLKSKVTKEIHKDLVKEDIKSIELHVFG